MSTPCTTISTESTCQQWSFDELLSLLAAEHKRISLENRRLADECKQLRDSAEPRAPLRPGSRRLSEGCVTEGGFYDPPVARRVRCHAEEDRPAARLPGVSIGDNTPPEIRCDPTDFAIPDEKHETEDAASAHIAVCKFKTPETPEPPLKPRSRLTKSFSRVRQHRTRLTLNDALRMADMRSANSNSWVINPERSKFLLHWDQVTLAALAFVAVITPVQVSMLDTCVDTLFFVNICVDLVFLVDMVLQFFLMYPMTTNYGLAYEHRHTNIVKHYLKGWFVIDTASILPFDVISVVSGSGDSFQKAKAVKVIRLLRLLKLARMAKVTRLFRRLEMRVAIAYQKLALAKFLTMLILITHWMANLWALTLIIVDPDEGIPRWVDTFEAEEANVILKTKDSNWKLYVTCLYFTSYTITSVGYGDIGPANITERIVCTLMIFASGITWALLIAQVCSIVSSMDSEDQNFRRVMDELNFMMADRGLPTALRRRLRSFFLSNKSAARSARYRELVESMSPALRGEVCLEMNRLWIGKVSFLDTFLRQAEAQHHDSRMQNFIVDVSRLLGTEIHAQGECFGQPQVLYVLNRGLASHTGRVRRSGAVWGKDFVLSNTALLEPYGSFALTYVEATFLVRTPFLDIVDLHRSVCPEILPIVRRYCGWLALQRWILLEAKSRIRELKKRRQQLEEKSVKD